MFAKKSLVIFGILFIALLFTAPVFAVGNLGTNKNNLADAVKPTGLEKVGDLPTLTGTVINTALGLVGLIFMVLMVYAGYLWMTARGENEQVEKAREIIIAAVIGLVVVLSAYAISLLVTSKLGADATVPDKTCSELEGNCIIANDCKTPKSPQVGATGCSEGQVCCK